MKELGMLCHCRYCLSKVDAVFDNGQPVEASYNNSIPSYYSDCKYIIVNGVKFPIERIVHTGGRYATWVYLEENEKVIILSANGKSFTDGKTKKEIEKEYNIIAEYEASIHGCSKIQCHQTLLIVKRKNI